MPEVEGEDIYTKEEKEAAKNEARKKKPLRLLAGQERLLTLKLKEEPKEPLEPGAISWDINSANALLETIPLETEKPDENGVFPIDQTKRKVTGVTVGKATVRITGVVNGESVRVEKTLDISEDNVGEDLILSDEPYMDPRKNAPKAPVGKHEGGGLQGARSSRGS